MDKSLKASPNVKVVNKAETGGKAKIHEFAKGRMDKLTLAALSILFLRGYRNQHLGEITTQLEKKIIGLQVNDSLELSLAPVHSPLTDEEETLFLKLKEWRRVTSKQDGISAFVIFSSEALNAIVAQKPQTIEQLRKLQGMGPKNTEKYGVQIVEMVLQHFTH